MSLLYTVNSYHVIKCEAIKLTVMRLWLLLVFRGKLFGEKKSIRFIIYILQNFADIFYKILVYIEMAAFMSFRCWYCRGAALYQLS